MGGVFPEPDILGNNVVAGHPSWEVAATSVALGIPAVRHLLISQQRRDPAAAPSSQRVTGH